MEPVLDERSNAEVEASIAEKHRQLCGLHRSLLAEVAEHDRRRAYAAWGAKDERAFLVSTLGLGWRTARDWVNAAHVLDRRPEIEARYVAGELSGDQLMSVVEMLGLRLPTVTVPVGAFGDDPEVGANGVGGSGGAAGESGGSGGSGDEGSGGGGAGGAGGDGLGGGGAGGDGLGGCGGGGDGGLGGAGGDGLGGCGGGGDGGAEDAGPDGSAGAGSGSDGLAPDAGASGDDGTGVGGFGHGGCGAGDQDGGAAAVGEVLGLAERLTPAQLAAEARRLRRRSRAEAAAAFRRRRVHAHFDEATGHLHAELDLFDDQALAVWSAWMEYAKRCAKDPVSGSFEPLGARMADATAEMASAYLAGRHQLAARPAVFAFAEASVLGGAEGWAESLYGPLAAESVRRMLCDCDLTLLAEGPDNRLFMGRTKRTATWQQSVMVIHRDGGCRFPGCHQRLFLHVHHLQEWAKDVGPTDYPLLLALCSRHHHLLHEGRWSVSGDARAELVFSDPAGSVRLSSWPNPAGAATPTDPSETDNRQRPPRAGPAVDARDGSLRGTNQAAGRNNESPVEAGAAGRNDDPGPAEAGAAGRNDDPTSFELSFDDVFAGV